MHRITLNEIDPFIEPYVLQESEQRLNMLISYDFKDNGDTRQQVHTHIHSLTNYYLLLRVLTFIITIVVRSRR